jgi:hypothetical protein
MEYAKSLLSGHGSSKLRAAQQQQQQQRRQRWRRETELNVAASSPSLSLALSRTVVSPADGAVSKLGDAPRVSLSRLVPDCAHLHLVLGLRHGDEEGCWGGDDVRNSYLLPRLLLLLSRLQDDMRNVRNCHFQGWYWIMSRWLFVCRVRIWMILDTWAGNNRLIISGLNLMGQLCALDHHQLFASLSALLACRLVFSQHGKGPALSCENGRLRCNDTIFVCIPMRTTAITSAHPCRVY